MDQIPRGPLVLGLMALVGLPALWLVPEEAGEKGVMDGTGWSTQGLGWTRGADEGEDLATWGEARRAFCQALGEGEWLATLGRVGRLLPIPEGVVLGGAIVLLGLSLAAQLGRVGERWVGRDVMVEWAVHLALGAVVGTLYCALLGVFLSLRRAEGRRATVLALAVVARVAFPLLGPLLCLDGGWDWVGAVWEAARRRFFL